MNCHVGSRRRRQDRQRAKQWHASVSLATEERGVPNWQDETVTMLISREVAQSLTCFGCVTG
jgi:hypothetical protein